MSRPKKYSISKLNYIEYIRGIEKRDTQVGIWDIRGERRSDMGKKSWDIGSWVIGSWDIRVKKGGILEI